MSATKLDEVIETVLRARADGPDALAAVALSFGAAMELGTLGNTALKTRLAEARDAMAAADEMVATMRHERDAAQAELKAARESAADTAKVWRLRESVTALRADIARVAAERDRAVQEREAFSLRLSAAERQRDEARIRVESLGTQLNAALARPTYEARTTAPTREEREAHRDAGGWWLVTWPDPKEGLCTEAVAGVWPTGTYPVGAVYVALAADRLPCAWPVPAAEVSP